MAPALWGKAVVFTQIWQLHVGELRQRKATAFPQTDSSGPGFQFSINSRKMGTYIGVTQVILIKSNRAQKVGFSQRDNLRILQAGEVGQAGVGILISESENLGSKHNSATEVALASVLVYDLASTKLDIQ